MGCTGSTSRKKRRNSSRRRSDESWALHSTDGDDIKHSLSDTTIRNILDRTKFTREEIIDWWHGFLADCPSGLLDKEKFIEVYQFKYPNGRAKGFCDHVFRTFNPDKRTRVIDFERFMCAINVTLKGSADEKLEWAFTMYDINGDERISKNEMSNVLESMLDLLGKEKTGVNSPKKQVDKIFERIDLNKDNYISKDEFFLGCKADDQIRAILAPYY